LATRNDIKYSLNPPCSD